MRRFRGLFSSSRRSTSPPAISTSVARPEWQSLSLSASLKENIQMLRSIFTNCSDIVFREFVFAQNEDIRLALVYIDGLVDKNQLSEQVMRALSLQVPAVVPGEKISQAGALEFIKQRGLCIHQVDETGRMERVVNAILSGDTVLLVDGHATALINSARGWETRAIEDSITDRVIRGPREAFVETLRTNTSLLRRKIKNPALKIETITLGRVTRTEVVIAYVEGIVNPKIVEEIRQRLGRIDLDGILEGGYIEELIEDNPFSPFSSINHTDRVDKVAALLLEGRAAIMVEGTPNVMTAPALFAEFLQNPEDYYQRYIFTILVRTIRILSFLITLASSAVYIALISYHPELLPTPLLLSLTAQREVVPFPAFVEVLIMEVIFEILREAGIRMPQPLGQAVSIVGALVLGDAAVRSGLVAPATVIVIALTAIASFTFHYATTLTIRLLRFPMFFLAALLGLPGLTVGLLIITIHLANLRSFGVPFLYPFAPLSPGELKDILPLRAPWWAMRQRPHLLAGQNLQREKAGLQPRPPAGRPGKEG